MLTTIRTTTPISSQTCAHRTRRLNATPARHAAAPRHIAVDLTPQAVEQIAIRVTQLLRRDQPPKNTTSPIPAWMTARELAHHLKLNPAWIYEHADELGAIRTGTGPKARMRFDVQTATEALREHQKKPATAGQTRPGRARQRPAPSTAPSAYSGDAPLLQARNPYARAARGRLSSAPWARGVK